MVILANIGYAMEIAAVQETVLVAAVHAGRGPMATAAMRLQQLICIGVRSKWQIAASNASLFVALW